jgi:vacuolar-type H+-ATPase subunit C/Vma6
MRNPKKLVFIHIPKTAGTSLRLLIESNYEPHERKSIYTYENLDNELQKASSDISRYDPLSLKVMLRW